MGDFGVGFCTDSFVGKIRDSLLACAVPISRTQSSANFHTTIFPQIATRQILSSAAIEQILNHHCPGCDAASAPRDWSFTPDLLKALLTPASGFLLSFACLIWLRCPLRIALVVKGDWGATVQSVSLRHAAPSSAQWLQQFAKELPRFAVLEKLPLEVHDDPETSKPPNYLGSMFLPFESISDVPTDVHSHGSQDYMNLWKVKLLAGQTAGPGSTTDKSLAPQVRIMCSGWMLRMYMLIVLNSSMP